MEEKTLSRLQRRRISREEERQRTQWRTGGQGTGPRRLVNIWLLGL